MTSADHDRYADSVAAHLLGALPELEEQALARHVMGCASCRDEVERLRAAVDAALEATELAGEADTNPYDLGRSRRKLLALASILAMGTGVLVVDEPTTGQDERGIEIVGRNLEAVAGAGR
nr:zf-HC2 domain-containing protein [Thermoleophilaceae bacterium]